MTTAEKIIDILEGLRFTCGRGAVEPFGARLPLITAWGIDNRTASATFVVDATQVDASPERWRELFFALASLRYELARPGVSALGTPFLLVIIDGEESGNALRALIEDVARDYSVFSRLEVGMIAEGASDAQLTSALAPVLPECRRALDRELVIDPSVLDGFASMVRDEVVRSADAVDPRVLESSKRAALEIADQLAEHLSISGGHGLRGDGLGLQAFGTVSGTDFRAFDRFIIQLEGLTVLEGRNGTGKSSVIEALELLWSGESQRKPRDEPDGYYARHLRRDGEHDWSLSGVGGGPDVSVDGQHPPTAPTFCRRNVFSQDLGRDVAGLTRAERFSELLAMTGLAIPALDDVVSRIRADGKARLDRELAIIGAAPLTNVRARGVDHVVRELKSQLSATFDETAITQLREAEQRVNAVSQELAEAEFRPIDLPDEGGYSVRLAAALLESAERLAADPIVVDELEDLALRLARAAVQLENRAAALERSASMLRALQRLRDGQELDRTPQNTPAPSAVPPGVAKRWLAARSWLMNTGGELLEDSSEVRDPQWRRSLESFALSLSELGEAVPVTTLEPMAEESVRIASGPASDVHPAVEKDTLVEAGFESLTPGAFPGELSDACSDVLSLYRSTAFEMRAASTALSKLPIVQLRGREYELTSALGWFEITRQLDGPVQRGQERLLGELIRGPLEPVLRELVIALTRFQWYFEPLRVEVSGNQVALRGMAATSDDSLDARMLLNAGERTLVNLAWFLSLYLLQPRHMHGVLVLDDPLGGELDGDNRAAVLSTLRAFTRLTRPQRLVLSAHDPLAAQEIIRNYSETDGWPTEVAWLKFERLGSGGASCHRVDQPAQNASFGDEVKRLGLATSA